MNKKLHNIGVNMDLKNCKIKVNKENIDKHSRDEIVFKETEKSREVVEMLLKEIGGNENEKRKFKKINTCY